MGHLAKCGVIPDIPRIFGCAFAAFVFVSPQLPITNLMMDQQHDGAATHFEGLRCV